MNPWKPISPRAFHQLFQEQYADLGLAERARFNRYRVDFWMASIRRSEQAGDENVYVVAQKNDGVLYFDDVEYGFNISSVDDTGRIVTPGGSQATLQEAIVQWFPEPGD